MSLKKLPILILGYNKLESLKKILTIIKKNKFQNIFISIDGPISSEKINARELRDYIMLLSQKHNYKINVLKKHQGCKIAVVQGINWFFKNVKQGVILEEDCIPDPSFFRFCYDLLNKYKNEKKIGQICGTNPLKSIKTKYSYFYSIYGGIWGWATWRDRWKNYDSEMKKWPYIKKTNKLNKIISNKFDRIIRKIQFEKTYNNKIDTWDYQWTFCKLINNYYSIIPKCNLIKNVGFTSMATHTIGRNSFANLNLSKMKFPLKYNDKIINNQYYIDKVVSKRIKDYIINKILRLWGR